MGRGLVVSRLSLNARVAIVCGALVAPLAVWKGLVWFVEWQISEASKGRWD